MYLETLNENHGNGQWEPVTVLSFLYFLIYIYMYLYIHIYIYIYIRKYIFIKIQKLLSFPKAISMLPVRSWKSTTMLI